jgi:hypothetical protein
MPTSFESSQPPHRRWNGIDVALVAIATFALIVLEIAVCTMSASMRSMLAEFAIVPPSLTRMALLPPTPTVAGFIYVALVMTGVRSILKHERSRGRVWIVSALAFGLLVSASFLYAMASPALAVETAPAER